MKNTRKTKGGYALLSLKEERELIRTVQGGGSEAGVALNTLISCNMGLTKSIARRYANLGVDLEDLIQAGNIGMMVASRSFDLERDNRFSTYATYKITNEVFDCLQKNARMIRIPDSAFTDFKKINAYREECFLNGEEEPDVRELAEHLSMKIERVVNLTTNFGYTYSLEAFTKEDEGKETEKKRPNDPAIAPEEDEPCFDFDRRENYFRLAAELQRLEPREKQIICRRYGMDGRKSASYEQIAKELNISPERVRQLEKGSVEKMRRGFGC